MYFFGMYLFIMVMLPMVLIKANSHKAEWILLLLMMSFVKTCAAYLFQATTVFTVVTIGSIQVHLDDIVLIILFGYCLLTVSRPFLVGRYLSATMFFVVPVLISLVRGALNGTIGSSQFLSDTRVFILFLSALFAMYFLIRKPKAISRLWVFEKYIRILMNGMVVFILAVWALDIGFGINYLPGQLNGTLSDAGSTFRMVNPPQVLMIAFYTLWEMSRDLEKKREISLRTLVFTAVIILMQWRTVIVAFLAGFVLVLVGSVKKSRISKKLAAEIVGLAVLLAGVMVVSGDSSRILKMVNKVFSSFANIMNGTGTFSTRTAVWTEIIQSLVGVNFLLGRPFGQRLGLSWTASAHSGYIDCLAKMGIVGVIGLIFLMVFLIRKAIKQKQSIIAVIVISLCVYWLGYGFSVEQGALLGFMAAILELVEKGRFVPECTE